MVAESGPEQPAPQDVHPPPATPDETQATTAAHDSAVLAAEQRPQRHYRAASLARVLVALAVVIVAVRFLGKLIAPSSSSFFLAFADRLSGPLVAPLQGSFVDAGSSTHVVEIASLVALAVVGLVGWGLVVLIRRLPLRRTAVATSGPIAPSRRAAPVAVACVLGAVVVVIAARAMLLGAGASSQSVLVNVLLHISSALVAPFQGIVADGGSAAHIIEFASLLAIVVYAVLGIAVLQLFRILVTPRGAKPPTIRQARSPFDATLVSLAVLAYLAGSFAVMQQYSPINLGSLASSPSSNVGDRSGSTDGNAGGAGSSVAGGGGTAIGAAPTAAATAHASCIPSVVASGGGVSWYRRVDMTSTAPCYSHWTVSLAGGSACGMWINGTRYAAPSNLWNITQWGQSSNSLEAVFYDQTSVVLTCVVNLGNYPQTTLNRSNW